MKVVSFMAYRSEHVCCALCWRCRCRPGQRLYFAWSARTTSACSWASSVPCPGWRLRQGWRREEWRPERWRPRRPRSRASHGRLAACVRAEPGRVRRRGRRWARTRTRRAGGASWRAVCGRYALLSTATACRRPSIAVASERWERASPRAAQNSRATLAGNMRKMPSAACHWHLFASSPIARRTLNGPAAGKHGGGVGPLCTRTRYTAHYIIGNRCAAQRSDRITRRL